MVTRLGDHIIYDNLKMGATIMEGEDDKVYLAFTDVDNDETHFFPVALTKVEQYLNLVRQTAMKQKVEIVGADQMPPPPQGA